MVDPAGERTQTSEDLNGSTAQQSGEMPTRKDESMSTRSVIARKTKSGFSGVYHHWDGYPSGVGATLFQVRNGLFQGNTKRLLEYLIDLHPGGWSTINKDWSKPEGKRANNEEQICTVCGEASWLHYRQYYKESFTACPSPWERASRPVPPDGSDIMVLGHAPKCEEIEIGPEPSGGASGKVTEKDAADIGCEYAYVFNGNGTMEIQSSYRPGGVKMIGAFGCGDPESVWKTIAVVDLDGKEPDWKAIDRLA